MEQVLDFFEYVCEMQLQGNKKSQASYIQSILDKELKKYKITPYELKVDYKNGGVTAMIKKASHSLDKIEKFTNILEDDYELNVDNNGFSADDQAFMLYVRMSKEAINETF